jgi:DNA-binding response OmpR family regulator
MLPERSGIEVCRALRSRDDTKKLPIIMLAAKKAIESSDSTLGPMIMSSNLIHRAK